MYRTLVNEVDQNCSNGSVNSNGSAHIFGVDVVVARCGKESEKRPCSEHVLLKAAVLVDRVAGCAVDREH